MGLTSMRQRRRSSDGGRPHGSDASPTKAPFEILERNWRRVASTHTLQDLLDADKPRQTPATPNFKLLALGVLLILGGAASLALGLFVFVVATLLPPLSNPWLAAVQQDRYYRLLVPLTVPVTIAAITLNWFSMKLFKHNS